MEYPADDYSLYGALWNVREHEEETGEVFHVRKDVNALHIAGYGAPLLMNAGFCGSNTPAGPDPCSSLDENGIRYRFSGNYLGHRAVANNVGMVDYDLNHENNFILEFRNDGLPANQYGEGACTFTMESRMDAMCSDFQAQISDGTISGSAVGEEAVAWRVIDLSDESVLDSGAGTTASFSFAGERGADYQVQFQNADSSWWEYGCKFNFKTAASGPLCQKYLQITTLFQLGNH